jgi:capsular polysaccharide biosynthesis protein
MDLVTILRDLWRRRVLVALAGIAAVLAAVVVAFQVPTLESRRYTVGLATTRVLVDTPRSQVVEVAPKGSDMLGVRANLLANLMVEGVVRAAIAERAGLQPKQLQGIAESGVDPSAAPVQPDPRGTAMTTRVVASTDGDLPLIEIEAQAPAGASAAKLANAAVEGLRGYLDSKAALEHVSDAKRLRVTGLGRAQAVEAVRGPGPVAAFAVGLLVFGLGCAAIVMLSAVMRSWRAANAPEDLQTGPASELVALDLPGVRGPGGARTRTAEPGRRRRSGHSA